MNELATHADADAPARCENCGAALQGGYCHDCGQSVHNPIRHLGHAVEEFFEAFWHLDGRVFRTLRDLQVPGRVAINYLAGHRARYIAPLRLFVVLSVLTFFIGSAMVGVGDGSAISVEGDGIAAFDAATSVEEVARIEDELTAGIEAARAAAGNAPGANPALVAAEVRIRGAAANRRVELAQADAAAGADDPTAAEGGDTDGVDAGADARASAPGDAAQADDELPTLRIDLFGHRGIWHPENNPMVIRWWPGFANDWLNRKIGRLQENMHTLGRDANGWVQAMLASAPSALFLLVPLFAVLLKIAYLFSGRLYLEHLVVALYSHVFLLIMLTLAFLLAALDNMVGSTLTQTVFGLGLFAVLLWMPLYLLLMQKRVYAQAWWLTIIKYLVVGNIYFMLLGVTTLLVFLARLSS